MKYTLNLVSLPASKRCNSYFVYEELSIEAQRGVCDDLFKSVLSDIPELKDHIERVIDSTPYIHINVANIPIDFDFEKYEEILLYYKLSSPEIFDSLFLAGK